MQPLALLWFQLQMIQRYLHEKTFEPAQSPANSANLNTPISRCNSDKAQYANTPALHHCARRDLSTSTKRLIKTGLYIAIAAFVQHSRCSQLESFSSDVQAIVSVVHPEKSGAATLQLPGQLSAYTDAPIYAQTSGYLKLWSFNIGAKVKANDILGEIDTPEVDQALAQAKAQLQIDQSALKLAQVTYQRYQRLFDQKVLDAQTRDTAADTYGEDQAKVAADQANI
jgi:multidrug efflux pump subunit AcrA (membrane-fusion protein)